MSVEAQTVEYAYAGNGATVAFPFPARFLNNADVLVGLNGVLQVSGYTVSGAGASGGGTVTFTVAPATGVRVALLRKPPLSQLIDFINGSTVLEGVLDDGLDKLTMISQYLLRAYQRTIRLSEFDVSSLSELPAAAARSNGMLGFDAGGAPKIYPTTGVTSTSVSNLLGEIVSATGLDMAAANTAGVRAAANGDILNIDVPITLTSGFAPGYPGAPAKYKFWPKGKFIQGGSGGPTFVSPIEADRRPIFDGFIVTGAANQLSLYPGTAALIEWFKWTGETNFTNALGRAMKSANNAVASLDVGNYDIQTDGGAATTAASATRSQTGLVGAGRDRTTITDKSFYMDTGNKLGANAALSVFGTNIATGGSHSVNPKIGNFKLLRDPTVTAVGGYALALVYTARAEVFNLQLEGYIGGMLVQRSTNAIIQDVHVHFPGPANHPITGVAQPYIGFNFDGTGTTPATPTALGNASSIGYRLAVSADNPNTASKGLWIHGGYSGDLHFEYFDTQGIGVGIHLDLTATFANTSGNADLIFDYLHLDGIKSVAMLIDGDVDNNSLWTVRAGWINITAGVGTTGYYIRNGKGGNLDLGQSGIGGRGNAYALVVENHVSLVAQNGQFKDTKRAMSLNGAAQCDVGANTMIRNVAAYPLEYGAYVYGGSTYNTVRLDTFTGSCSGSLLHIAAGANNYNEVFIGNFDTSGMATHTKHGQTYPLVASINAGATGNRIHYEGPDTHILDNGVSTLVWTDWSPYAAASVTSSGSGAFADVTVTASYKREGSVCRMKGIVVIGAAGVGAATGVPIVTLPVGSFTALAALEGTGFVYTTGSFPTGIKWMNPTIVASALRLYLQDGTSPITNSTTLEFDISYRTA